MVRSFLGLHRAKLRLHTGEGGLGTLPVLPGRQFPFLT